MQMLGLAIGPALAATVIAPLHYDRVNWLAIAFFLVSWICILPPVLSQQRRAQAARPAWAYATGESHDR